MDELKTFLELYKPRLLQRLEHRPLISTRSGLEFVDTVLDSWSMLPEDIRRQSPDRVERAFWWALYVFEDAVELTPMQWRSSQAELIRFNCSAAIELLRSGSELPTVCHATRPDELQFLDPLEPLDVYSEY